MITRLTLKNFKRIQEQTYAFSEFDLLVGRNNSGKSTVLQALAIWQFCVDTFRHSQRRGTTGIQVVLPNFTALPVPEFNLLWNNRTDRQYPVVDGKKKQEFILIEIGVEWRQAPDETAQFTVQLRYHSPQTVYAIPKEGWTHFRKLDEAEALPKIAYVPPFSGLEPSEKWLDRSPIRQQVGKGQPGSVLRNLLLRVSQPEESRNAGESEANQTDKQKAKQRAKKKAKKKEEPVDWKALVACVERWFGVEVLRPTYDPAKDVYIVVEYRQGDKDYDIIAGGSGFHQVLTLLGFLYGYKPTTILLDEPDAHLHVNLQRALLDYFKSRSNDQGVQFLIATHAEEFAKGVNPSQIYSLLRSEQPRRIDNTENVLRAMADVSNEDIARAGSSPVVVYVEGEVDERLIRAWAGQCGGVNYVDHVYFKPLGGGDKTGMLDRSGAHFKALREILPQTRQLILFDRDKDPHEPEPENKALYKWPRRNIENYLLVPDAWRRAAAGKLGVPTDDLLFTPVAERIDDFFARESLTLPPGADWRTLKARGFQDVDGKQLLFEGEDSLFQLLRRAEPPVEVLKEQIALCMTPDEIHEDVHRFIGKIVDLVRSSEESA